MAEDVFISYSHENKDAARILAEMVGAKGYGVWWDHELVAGDSYTEVIEQKLDNAKAVIVIWSEQSRKSHWVRDEAAVGRDRNRLLPVAIDSNPPPLGFRQIQTIDLAGWDGRDLARLSSLFRGLAGLMGQQPQAHAQAQASAAPASANPFGDRAALAPEPALAAAKGGKVVAGVNAAPNNKPLRQILHEEKKQRSFFRTYWLTSFLASGVLSVICGLLLASQWSSGMGGEVNGSAPEQVGIAFVFVGFGLFVGRFFVIVGRRLSKRKSIRYFDQATSWLLIVSVVLCVPVALFYNDPDNPGMFTTFAEKLALGAFSAVGVTFPLLAFFSMPIGFFKGLGRTSYADGK